SLSDGTPLVTRKQVGQGQIVLFHVTATAEWSTLPLSGLFVQMMERLAISSSSAGIEASDLQGTTWTPLRVMDGFGTLSDAGTLPGVDGADLMAAPAGPDLQPGVYASGDRRIARNVVVADTTLTPAAWPADVPVRGLDVADEQPLAGWLLSLSILLLLADVIASLSLSGRLLRHSNAAGLILAALIYAPTQADAQADDSFALNATAEMTLAYVITGNASVDEMSDAGLRGLSDTLYFRTSVEPANPIGVDL
ncbi:MAG TPA: LytTR family transcriptional regulator, partial [Sulfitobacter sp.]|nr:LytTR family transcriptional regulator [Sulfitobacter sp.]